MEGVGEVLKRKPGRPRKYADEESQTLLNYVADFAREFADQATLQKSASRIINDYQKWGRGDINSFIGVLYQARATTKEHSAAIRGSKFAYFCSIVEDLLGLRDNQAAPSVHN